MRYDLHVHHRNADACPSELVDRLGAAGLDGCCVLSQSYVVGFEDDRTAHAPKDRIKNVMAFTKGRDGLIPFYFIDPTEPDAEKQVDMAIDAGVMGFKTICTHFFPSDERAVPVYHKIAATGKPYLFHSGILYDGSNASGNYNRPCNFEVLLSVPRLRFALAHISWPWTDECIAVYGKFNNYLENFGPGDAPEMFVDTTPGTPARYRRDALAKFLDMGGAADHILWGSDCSTDYSTEYAQSIRDRDEGIAQELDLDEDFLDKWYHRNFMRFLKG